MKSTLMQINTGRSKAERFHALYESLLGTVDASRPSLLENTLRAAMRSAPSDGCFYTFDEEGLARLARNAERGNPNSMKAYAEYLRLRLSR